MTDIFAKKMQKTGVKLLWGTANLFSHPRYMSGAATNPDPDVFAYAAAQVKNVIDATHKLDGANYVLWGGREGYETLLNTDLRREQEQLGRFLSMVVDYKHKIGFKGVILVEPKPQEPTKHQYDFDVATVFGFLQRFGLEREVKLNIEVGHAVLAHHSFEHEIALATALGMLGSIDANRNDYQSGWDTDQFPNNAAELVPALYFILKAGGLAPGGFNFDSKVRRQSIDPADLLLGHIGGIDVCAAALVAAAHMIEDGKFDALRAERYAGWDKPEAKAMLTKGATLDDRSRRGSPRRRSTRSRSRDGRNITRTCSTAISDGLPALVAGRARSSRNTEELHQSVHPIFAFQRDAPWLALRRHRGGGMFGRVVFVATLCVTAALLGSFSLLERLPAPAPVAAADAAAPAAVLPPSDNAAAEGRSVAGCSRIARPRFGPTDGANMRPTRSSTACRSGCLSTPAQATLSSPLRPPHDWALLARENASAPIQTANGRSKASPAVLTHVSFGGIYMNDVEALILAPEAGDVNLLGESFLKRLVSVEQRDGMLICGSD